VTCITEPIRVTPGRCYLNLALQKSGGVADQVETAAYFDVESENLYGQGTIPERQVVLCLIDQRWSVSESTANTVGAVAGSVNGQGAHAVSGTATV